MAIHTIPVFYTKHFFMYIHVVLMN